MHHRRRFAEQSPDDINEDDIVVVVNVNNNNRNSFYDDISFYKTLNGGEFDFQMDSTNHTFFTHNIDNATVLPTENISSSEPQAWIDPISYEWRILWLIVSMSIFVVGGVANIMTAYVILYTNRAMRRASYVLIAGVAIADVWMCLLAHPSEVVASACAFLWHTELPAWWCPVNETLLEIFSCTSILAQMWVAVNRGIAVFA